MADFKNRLHEQLARRSARDAFRSAGDGEAATVACEPCEAQFTSADEEELRAALLEHYKTAAHRRATNLTVDRQRELRR